MAIKYDTFNIIYSGINFSDHLLIDVKIPKSVTNLTIKLYR